MPVLHYRQTPLHLERGVTRALDALPPRSVALDGFVPGPAVDAAQRRYSFDHHAGCVRHATLSTCEMTLDALRVGLDPTGLGVYINDLDADTLLAAWLLGRPEVADAPAVRRLVARAGRLDALGPAVGVRPPSALVWALQPIYADLRSLPEDEWAARALDALGRLDAWFDAGCPGRDARFAPPRSAPAPLVVHAQGDTPLRWALAEAPTLGAFAQLYQQGYRAGVVYRPLSDGTWEYTVGKASEFVAAFDVPALLSALRDAERAANPQQPDDATWGGGSTIGGSPRNRDGSASRLSPERVLALLRAALTPPA